MVEKVEMQKDRETYVKALAGIKAQLEKNANEQKQLVAQAQRIQGAIAYIDGLCKEEETDDEAGTAEDGEAAEVAGGVEEDSPAGS